MESLREDAIFNLTGSIMENTDLHFGITTTVEEDFVYLVATGDYSPIKADHLFSYSVENALLHKRAKILIDVTRITGNIPFFDRFEYSAFLAKYVREFASTKVGRIAVVGVEPIVDKNKFGETVAINRGANAQVFTDMDNAYAWLMK